MADAQPSSSRASARSGSPSIPISSAVRSRIAASSKASATHRRSRRTAGCSRSPARPRRTGRRRRSDGRGRRARGPTAAPALSSASANAQVQLGPPQPREPVIKRPSHDLVGEATGQPLRGELLDHSAARSPPRERRAARTRQAAAQRTGSSSNSGPADGGELEQVGGPRAPGAIAAG